MQSKVLIQQFGCFMYLIYNSCSFYCSLSLKSNLFWNVDIFGVKMENMNNKIAFNIILAINIISYFILVSLYLKMYSQLFDHYFAL